jgi:hypothetical protein
MNKLVKFNNNNHDEIKELFQHAWNTFLFVIFICFIIKPISSRLFV